MVTETLAVDDLPATLNKPGRSATVSASIHLLGAVAITFERDEKSPTYGHLTIQGGRDGSNGRFTLTLGAPPFADPANVIAQLEGALVGLRDLAAER